MSGSCCCLDIYPSEWVDLSLVRARKRHTCVECGDSIQPGSLYERAEVLDDGVWSRFRTCARCCNVRDEFFTCGWYFGEVVEDFRECFGFDYREGIPEDFAPCRPVQAEQST